MNEGLTDEAYARAALTYLAEPADRWLGQLLRLHGAPATLDAIKVGRLLRTARPSTGGGAAAEPDRPHPASPTPAVAGGGGAEDHDASAGDHHGDAGTMAGALPGIGDWADDQGSGGRARQSLRSAMERWRLRLPCLPVPDEVIALRQAGIRLIGPSDPEWPGQLADLGDAQPYALWLRGSADLRFSCLRSVAIVGSRAATAYGSYVAAEFAASVAARGLAVVSGGAFGIDAAAHRGALGADGVTVAVLASGVDTPYPAAHAELFDAIAAQGVIVSEWPPGSHVSRLRFLVRNRVIAGLAAGTLVVEAARRSGAVNTARHARDLHRRVMAVPGPVTSDLSAGCHDILRDWQGLLVTSAPDVVEHLSPVGSGLPGDAADPAQAGHAAGTRSSAPLPRDLLDQDYAKVLDAMPRRGGMGTLRVAQRAALTPAATAMCLGGLAAAGFVERCDDGWRLRHA